MKVRIIYILEARMNFYRNDVQTPLQYSNISYTFMISATDSESHQVSRRQHQILPCADRIIRVDEECKGNDTIQAEQLRALEPAKKVTGD
jgi:hypothetical protein